MHPLIVCDHLLKLVAMVSLAAAPAIVLRTFSFVESTTYFSCLGGVGRKEDWGDVWWRVGLDDTKLKT